MEMVTIQDPETGERFGVEADGVWRAESTTARGGVWLGMLARVAGGWVMEIRSAAGHVSVIVAGSSAHLIDQAGQGRLQKRLYEAAGIRNVERI